ncbi:hypothetical protein ACOSQ2_021103 [Xanthoceras sorbifolium]
MSSSMNLGEKSQNTLRSTSYSNEEDQLLCRIYIDVSQNSIIGINQSSLQFWSRIETEYHKALPEYITQVRPRRSLQSRMQVITTAIGKLRGCLNRAKALLAEDQNFKKGFKFDHVWPLLKDTEKYTYNIMITPSRRNRNDCTNEALQSSSPSSKSPRESSFCVDLNADFEREDPIHNNSDSFGRPAGVKKEKTKKKQGEEMIQFCKSMKEENKQLTSMFKESKACMQETQSLMQNDYQLQLLRAQNEAKKLELRERCEENKILERDVDSINDPMIRDALRSEQMRIYAKRARDQQFEGGSGSSNTFSQFFGGSGGSGYNLSDY